MKVKYLNVHNWLYWLWYQLIRLTIVFVINFYTLRDLKVLSVPINLISHLKKCLFIQRYLLLHLTKGNKILSTLHVYIMLTPWNLPLSGESSSLSSRIFLSYLHVKNYRFAVAMHIQLPTKLMLKCPFQHILCAIYLKYF